MVCAATQPKRTECAPQQAKKEGKEGRCDATRGVAATEIQLERVRKEMRVRQRKVTWAIGGRVDYGRVNEDGRERRESVPSADPRATARERGDRCRAREEVRQVRKGNMEGHGGRAGEEARAYRRAETSRWTTTRLRQRHARVATHLSLSVSSFFGMCDSPAERRVCFSPGRPTPRHVTFLDFFSALGF